MSARNGRRDPWPPVPEEFERQGFEIDGDTYVWPDRPDWPVRMLLTASANPWAPSPALTVNTTTRVAADRLIDEGAPGPLVYLPGQVEPFAWADETVRLSSTSLLSGNAFADSGSVLHERSVLAGRVQLRGPSIAPGTTLAGRAEVLGDGMISPGTHPFEWRAEGEVVVTGTLQVLKTGFLDLRGIDPNPSW